VKVRWHRQWRLGTEIRRGKIDSWLRDIYEPAFRHIYIGPLHLSWESHD
jgi:hypothetical protein